jgi:hypothetical protein
MERERLIQQALIKAARMGLRGIGDVINESGNRAYVLRALTTLTTDIKAAFDLYGAFYGTGTVAMQGLVDGLKGGLTKANTEAIRLAGKAVQELWLAAFATRGTVSISANDDGSFDVIPKPGEIIYGQFGASVRAGQPVVVGEAGKELFVPKQDGDILPMSKVRSGSGGGTNININVGGSVVTERDLAEVVMEGIVRAQRHGWRAGA